MSRSQFAKLLDKVGTSSSPVSEVNTEQGLIQNYEANVKVGVIADTHWGSYGGSGLSDSETMLKNKLDEFATEMNNWGADVVLFLGDNAHETSPQSNAEQRIINMRDYIEPKLDCGVNKRHGGNVDVGGLNYLFGNHETDYYGSWGIGWNYDEYGFSTTSDTYYAIEYPEVKLLCLQNNYKEQDGNYPHYLAPNELDWIKTQLEETEKPIVVFSHIPISRGPNTWYDRLNSDNDWKLPLLLGRYENVIVSIYGHCHHAQSNPVKVSEYNRTNAQDYYGTKHIYQHFPHRLGGTSPTGGDTSYTPFGKLHIFSHGMVIYEQSYAGKETGFQEYFKSTHGYNSNPYQELQENRTVDYRPSLTSDVYRDSGDGSITNSFGGAGQYRLVINSGATSGNSHKAQLARDLWGLESVPNSFLSQPTDMIWNVVFIVNDVTQSLYELKRGALKGSGSGYIGFEVDNGDLIGVVADKSETRTTCSLGSIGAGSPIYLQLIYRSDIPRVDFTWGRYYRDKNEPSISSNIPTDESAMFNLAQFVAKTTEGVEKTLKIADFKIQTAPKLEMIQ